jgi:predicted transcriptional regulator
MTFSLTELQVMIMTVLWEKGEAGVADIHDALRSDRRIAQSTVATLLSRMEEKGVVARREQGRQFLYRAAVAPESVRRSIVREFSGLTDRLFSGDVASLVSHLLHERDVNPADLARARKIIEAKEKELKEKGKPE